MDKLKINIDQYFKQSLQNFEGNAGEGMFNEIKKGIDNATTPKISVDDFFKGAMMNFEGHADESMFHEIKGKVDASKVPVDTYFREALLDYNSYAMPIPFSEIQSKLDREKVIDEHFKSALQNYEAKAHDKEFAVIRERVLEIQQKAARKRYAWLLILLIIPSALGIYFYNQLSDSTGTAINGTKSQHSIPLQPKESINERTENEVLKSESTTNKPNDETKNPKVLVNRTNQASAAVNSNSRVQPSAVVKKAEVKQNTESKIEEKSSVTRITDTTNKGEDLPENTPQQTTLPEVTPQKADGRKLAQKTSIKKPVSKYTVKVFVAATRNGRYLQADAPSNAYLAARNASDRTSTKLNFGVDLIRKEGKMRVGFGVHQNHFGQFGEYSLTRNIHDSTPHYGSGGNIIGYWYINHRDTTFSYSYNNNYTSVEIPLHFSYNVCNFAKFEFEVGMAASVSYIVAAKGALPDSKASEVMDLKLSMNSMNRMGATGTVSMKLNYNINSKWQAGTELYTNSNMRSVFKKTTGVNELPYAFGMRWGLGYKF